MTKHTIDIEKLERDFSATKIVGKGKNAIVVPDHKRRLSAVRRYLRLRLGSPKKMTMADLP